MTSTEIGNLGENAAIEYLNSKGLKLLYKNWRHRRLEVDMIYACKNSLIFVEVKARSSYAFGAPEAFVTIKKQKHLLDAADAYCYKCNYDGEIRFDIVSILLNPCGQVKEIKHFEDAFYEIG